MTKAVATQGATSLGAYLKSKTNQIAVALPKHLDADRMIRLAMTCVSQNKDLRDASMSSVLRAVLLASQTGLEIGVGGQAYLVPYNNRTSGEKEAQFVPGWQGLVDLVSRSGRATVWTGAVFKGDEFDWALGDQPFVRHRPGGENDEEKLTHVYAVGRVNGSHHPVIEVWTRERVVKHRNKFNKVGTRHYSFANFEMYARKVALLQVLKYMPKSIEMQRAIVADHASTNGTTPQILDGDFLPIDDLNPPADDSGESASQTATAEPAAKPALPEEQFAAKLDEARKLITSMKKTASQYVAMLETKHTLTDEQQAAIRKIEADMNVDGSKE